jgi:glyoxylase I family protein
MEETATMGTGSSKILETDIKRDNRSALDAIAKVRVEPRDHEAAAQARAKNPLLHVDHFAFACRDPQATRDFYENLLGMPLVTALVFEDDIVMKGETYCHFFFEMADGNFIAFFDHTGMFEEKDFEPKSGFHHHVAFEVSSDEMVQNYRRKLEAAGVPTNYIDHGQYHSIYFTDPNGINLEITFKPEATAEFEAKSRKIASDLFNDWLAKRDGARAASLARRPR